MVLCLGGRMEPVSVQNKTIRTVKYFGWLRWCHVFWTTLLFPIHCLPGALLHQLSWQIR